MNENPECEWCLAKEPTRPVTVDVPGAGQNPASTRPVQLCSDCRRAIVKALGQVFERRYRPLTTVPS